MTIWDLVLSNDWNKKTYLERHFAILVFSSEPITVAGLSNEEQVELIKMLAVEIRRLRDIKA